VLLYFGLCFAVAALSYHLLELPFLRLKDRFAYSDEQQAGSLRVDGEVTEPATVGAF
jgi:peptidoglycan/LPS O-acetylase OafA/YrhL